MGERIIRDLSLAIVSFGIIYFIWYIADAMYHIATWPGLPLHG